MSLSKNFKKILCIFFAATSVKGDVGFALASLSYLEIVAYEALLEGGGAGVLDGEVPAAEDLVGHVHAVTLADHPRVLVADRRPVKRRLEGEQLDFGREHLFSQNRLGPRPADLQDEAEEEDAKDSRQIQ